MEHSIPSEIQLSQAKGRVTYQFPKRMLRNTRQVYKALMILAVLGASSIVAAYLLHWPIIALNTGVALGGLFIAMAVTLQTAHPRLSIRGSELVAKRFIGAGAPPAKVPASEILRLQVIQDTSLSTLPPSGGSPLDKKAIDAYLSNGTLIATVRTHAPVILVSGYKKEWLRAVADDVAARMGHPEWVAQEARTTPEVQTTSAAAIGITPATLDYPKPSADARATFVELPGLLSIEFKRFSSAWTFSSMAAALLIFLPFSLLASTVAWHLLRQPTVRLMGALSVHRFVGFTAFFVSWFLLAGFIVSGLKRVIFVATPEMLVRRVATPLWSTKKQWLTSQIGTFMVLETASTGRHSQTMRRLLLIAPAKPRRPESLLKTPILAMAQVGYAATLLRQFYHCGQQRKSPRTAAQDDTESQPVEETR